MNESLDRLKSPSMSYYKSLYRKSKKWNGEPLKGKTVIIYCEQGFGDIIQFSRYFRTIMEMNCFVILHCPKDLHKLFSGICNWFITKDVTKLPPHDYHILSMSLPFFLNEVYKESETPYLNIRDKYDLEGFENKYKIGIAWEGNPNHSNNNDRSCPLEHFSQLTQIKNSALFMLQKAIHNTDLVKNCEKLPLNGVELNDFYDTARLINAMDIIVTVDTSVLHLAGALGRPAIGLISYKHDSRWLFKKWYPSVRLIRQRSLGDWNSVFEEVYEEYNLVRKFISVKKEFPPILLTGGVGDVITLESYIPNENRKKLKTIYCATKAYRNVQELFSSIKFNYPALERIEPIWTDFRDIFAFYSKADCQQMLNLVPADWNKTEDWSILCKFDDINHGLLKYNYSSFLENELIPINKFSLPDHYVAIVPSSNNHPDMKDRNFNEKEWKLVINFLKRNNLPGVILSTDDLFVPTNRLLINLTNKTTLVESIEIVKQASGYIGIDSCLSVVASKLFSDKFLLVKSKNEHLFRWKHVYYAPNKKFDFIKNKVRFV